MTAAERAEKEYQRGVDLESRGLYTSANVRYKRAERGGINVGERRGKAGGLPEEKQTVKGASYSENDETRARVMQQLRDAKASDADMPLPQSPPPGTDIPRKKDPIVFPSRQQDAVDEAEDDSDGGTPVILPPNPGSGDWVLVNQGSGPFWKLLTPC